ncbi:MAG: outer membrane beta-barrel protein [Alphaproteobacteria bacterium]|nr:outer membrane beta-barrel protein [Alphaproteobacteria bacterium]
MKLNQISLSLMVAAFAAISVPASAADWNYGAGSIKDTGPVAVPVPAPVPIPEYSARYYFRVDAGIGLGDGPEASESGYYYGGDASYGRRELGDGWLTEDFDTFVTFGVGVGMYISDRFRVDVTAETRSRGEVEIDGNYRFETVELHGAWEDVYGTVHDKTSVSGGIFLLNGYYDFNRGPQSRFTPYVGAGIGFAWNELRRVHGTSEASWDCDAGGCRAPRTVRDSQHVTDKTHDLSIAAMASVGLGYRINDYMLLDMNYRYLFVDSTDAGFSIRGEQFGGDSKVSIGAMHEHQLRAGLRFDVN